MSLSWVLNEVAVPAWFLMLLFASNLGGGVMQFRAARFRDAYRKRTGADLPTVPVDLSGLALAENLLMLAQLALNVAIVVGFFMAACDRIEVHWRGGVHGSTAHGNTPGRTVTHR